MEELDRLRLSTSDKATAGTLYRVSDIQESGSVTFDVTSSDLDDKHLCLFKERRSGLDNADGYKLFPLNPIADRLVAISLCR